MSVRARQRKPNADGPVDGALDAVARLADPELAVGLLEGRPRSPTGQN
jgi:hypothetical protein